jgi:aminopeptidase N
MMTEKWEQRAKVVAVACIAAAVLVLTASHLSADTYPRQKGIRITHYTFDVILSDASDEITMKETVDADLLDEGITGIDLDLCGPHAKGATAKEPGDPCVGRTEARGLSGQANSAASRSPTGMTVTAASEAGRPLTFTQKGDIVHLPFASPSRAGQHVTFTISYHGVPATGLRIGNNRHNDRSFISNDWPNLAHNWLATIDHISMKAPKTMIVTAPARYQVISNGLLTQQMDLPNGLRRTVWDEKVPIPTWQFSLAVAPYAVDYFGEYHGIALSSWVFPQERDNGYKGFSEVTQSILEFYIDHIGPYSYEKLAQVQANSVSGGMELASDIFYGYNGVPRRQLAAHEMAHQWFGNSASENDWDHVWLSEGFATYFALLYQEHEDGRDAFLAGVHNSAQNAMRYVLANPESTIVHKNLSNISQVIANNAQIYQGGAQVLHMLRGVLGTENFWKGIRLYYSRFQNRNASSDDLRVAMQDACAAGENCPQEGRDLRWFFDEWLNRGGILQVSGSWHYDDAAKQLHIRLDQTQTVGLYRMPIEIGVSLPPPPPAPAGSRRGGGAPDVPPPPPKIMIDQRHNELVLPLEAAPLDVRLDPNSWVTMMQGTLIRQ